MMSRFAAFPILTEKDTCACAFPTLQSAQSAGVRNTAQAFVNAILSEVFRKCNQSLKPACEH